MRLTFDDALTVGRAEDLVERQRAVGAPPTVPISAIPRGLALKSLKVTGKWDWLWKLLNRSQQIYFVSVAMDLSGQEPTVLPPAQVPADSVYKVRHGEAIEFTLGDGVPLFPPRVITGGLMVYLIVSEADKGIRHVGETMTKIHQDLKDVSLAEKLVKLVSAPAATIVDEAILIGSAMVQPVATALENNSDDAVGVFSGYYPAKGPWVKKLASTRNGTSIILGELR
jgi:hypothetical protein